MRLGLPLTKYRGTLTSKLPPKIKADCLDIIADNTKSYDDFKERLLDKSGICLHEIELKSFVTLQEDMRNVDRVEVCRKLKKLKDRLLLGAKTIQDTQF